MLRKTTGRRFRRNTFASLTLVPLVAHPEFSCLPTPEEPKPSPPYYKVEAPPKDTVYHAAYPDFGGWEDEVSAAKISNFQDLAQKPIAWAYFSNNWWPSQKGIHFPAQAIAEIQRSKTIPYVRMMPRSQDLDNGNIKIPDPTYSMQSFIDGTHDAALREWALAAKAYKEPLMVEFGTEANGDWFPWNAKYNGAQEKTGYGDPELYDGMERFRDAYRHIIQLFHNQEVRNITWVFHVNLYSSPEADWNRVTGYYPGDDYIDWIGISAYGAQVPEDTLYSMKDMLDDRLSAIDALTQETKPIALVEWGATEQEDPQKKSQWIQEVFALLAKGGAYQGRIQAISYWHENFDETTLRIDSSPLALGAYQEGLQSNTFLGRANIEESADD